MWAKQVNENSVGISFFSVWQTASRFRLTGIGKVRVSISGLESLLFLGVANSFIVQIDWDKQGQGVNFKA
jgi:hypothetical protein